VTPGEAIAVVLANFDLFKMLALLVLPCVVLAALAAVVITWEDWR
jgi:hypothetical protein